MTNMDAKLNPAKRIMASMSFRAISITLSDLRFAHSQNDMCLLSILHLKIKYIL